MKPNEQLLTLYKKLYEQRSLLTQAPALTIDPTNANPNNFPAAQAAGEVRGVVSYLLGIKNVDAISIPEAIKICQRAYAEQKFWLGIILDYLLYRNNVEKIEIERDGVALLTEAQGIMTQIQQNESYFQTDAARFATKIREAGFHVDADKLIRNYIRMAGDDEAKAYTTLITNPVLFAPIQRTDKNGNEIITKDQAEKENKNLAAFLKGLTA